MKLEKRIQPSNQLSEKEYRALKGRISSSDIRIFIKSRKSFYNQCVLGYKDENNVETASTILGNIADCILTCGQEEVDKRFVIASAGVPGGQLGELCEVLYKRAMKGMRMEEDGSYTQTESFEVLFNDAVETVRRKDKFKGKEMDKILELFIKPDKDGIISEHYYREKLNHIGKTVVDVDMLASGEKIANDLRTSPYTMDVINMENTEDIQVFKQMIVLFTYRGIELRGMLDQVEVNHLKKYIQPYDIKTTYDNEGFDRSYLKGLYIQAATYDKGLHKWAIEHGLDDYEILPMKYPVADTCNENIPLMYNLTEEDLRRAYKGFYTKGSSKWYPGLDETLDAIKWHVDTGIWNVSKYAYDKQGKLELEIEYK
jgi:hypothetical protein